MVIITTFREDGCIRGRFNTEETSFRVDTDSICPVIQRYIVRAWDIPYNGRIEIEIIDGNS